MAESFELMKSIETNQKTIEEVGTKLLARDHDGAIASLVGLTTAVLTGVPGLGGLAKAATARAFANSATAKLRAELEALEREERQREFLGNLGQAVETLLGQALIQIGRMQHAIKDETLEALGGVRKDLQDFRERFEHELKTANQEAQHADVHIGRVEAHDEATGVRIEGLKVSSSKVTFISEVQARGRSVGVVIS